MKLQIKISFDITQARINDKQINYVVYEGEERIGHSPITLRGRTILSPCESIGTKTWQRIECEVNSICKNDCMGRKK